MPSWYVMGSAFVAAMAMLIVLRATAGSIGHVEHHHQRRITRHQRKMAREKAMNQARNQQAGAVRT